MKKRDELIHKEKLEVAAAAGKRSYLALSKESFVVMVHCRLPVTFLSFLNYNC